MHRPRRVIPGNVQGLEVVKVVFDFRSFRGVEAERGKDLAHALHRTRHRVQRSAGGLSSRQRDVDPFALKLRLDRLRGQGLHAGADTLGQLLLEDVDRLPELLAQFGWKTGDLLQLTGNGSLFTEQPNTHLLEGIRSLRLVDGGQRFLREGAEIFQGCLGH